MLYRGLFREASRGAKTAHTGKTFEAFMQRNASPLPSDCRSLQQDVHALRVGSTIRPSCMHAPKEGIVFEDCPLHSLQGRNGRAKTALDRSRRSSIVELLMLRFFDALGHGGMRHPSVPQRVRAWDQGARESYTGSSSFPAAMSTLVTLFPWRRFAKHDANCERDCCSCVSLSPVTATP